jgi:N-acetylmuramoyl-L-alanine amidase
VGGPARAAAALGLLLAAGCSAAPPSPPAAGPTSPPAVTSTAATAASAAATAASAPAGTATPTASPVATSPRPSSVPATPSASPAPSPTPSPTRARRPVVVLDPGHNGGNASHYAEVSRLVEAGGGRRKPCNEVGTETVGGYPEHAFAWDVAVRARALLAARGVDVRLTRPDDTGVGPCVDVRGRFGGRVRADAVVSVHADGAAPGGSGFHVIEASRSATAAGNHRLALAVRAALRSGSGLGYADYLAGGDGLDQRDDLAGLNLATRPSVLVECGNMRNAGDAALLTAPAGRQRIAAALAAGILAYLG